MKKHRPWRIVVVTVACLALAAAGVGILAVLFASWPDEAGENETIPLNVRNYADNGALRPEDEDSIVSPASRTHLRLIVDVDGPAVEELAAYWIFDAAGSAGPFHTKLNAEFILPARSASDALSIAVWHGACVPQLFVVRYNSDTRLTVLRLRRRCGLTARLPGVVDEGLDAPLSSADSVIENSGKGCWVSITYDLADFTLPPRSVVERVIAAGGITSVRDLGKLVQSKQMSVTASLPFDPARGHAKFENIPEDSWVSCRLWGDGIAESTAKVFVTYPSNTTVLAAVAGSTLRVSVVDTSGRKVPGTQVMLHRHVENTDKFNIGSTLLGSRITDLHAEVLFTVAADLPLVVSALSDRGAASETFTPRAGANELTLTLSQANVLTGQIVDDAGISIPNVDIRTEWKSRSFSRLIQSNDGGYFTTYLPPGINEVTLSLKSTGTSQHLYQYYTDESIARVSKELISLTGARVVIQLQRKPSTEQPGVLKPTLSWDRTPARPTVKLEGEMIRESKTYPGAQELGMQVRLEIPVDGGEGAILPPGIYRLRATEENVVNGRMLVSDYETVQVRGQELVRRNFHLREAAALLVKVFESATGLPLAHQAVIVDDVISREFETDKNGFANLGLQSVGEHRLSLVGSSKVFAKGNSVPVIVAVESGVHELMADEAGIQVVVTIGDDVPMGDVLFVLSPISRYAVIAADKTDPATFGFRGVRRGTWHVQAWSGDGKKLLNGIRVDIADYETKHHVQWLGTEFKLMK